MRRRPPPEVDPDRLRSLLASARPRPAPTGTERVGSRGGARVGRVGRPGVAGRGGPGGERSPGTFGLPAGEGPAGGGSGSAGEGRHRPPPRVLTVPVAFRGARVAVSVRAVVAFVLVLVVAAVFFAVRVARAQQAAAPQSVPTGEGLVERGSVPAAFATGATGAAGATAGDPSQTSGASARGSPGRLVVIDVVGQVARPGVVTVPDGSRGRRRAGRRRWCAGRCGRAAAEPRPAGRGRRAGLRPTAGRDPTRSGRRSERCRFGSGAGSAGTGAGGAPAAVALVDLNTATLAALDTLPGVGPVLAQRILDWRAQHGRFASVDELGEVSGIGDKLLEQIRPKVRV